jgi:carboxypeptidase Taq
MTDPYRALEETFRKLSRIDHAITFLQWDHMVMMPPAGNMPRSEALAELSALHHEILLDGKVGAFLSQAGEQSLDQIQHINLREMQRTYDRAACLTTSLVKAQTLAGSKCEHDWRRQRQENDWDGFKNNFQAVVNLAREEAQIRFEKSNSSYSTRYDAMLDLYCTGDSSEFIEDVFSQLKEKLPPLLQRIVEKQKKQPPPHLAGTFPIPKQKELSRSLMQALGFDFNAGRMDVSAHPFSTGCTGDQRITTRFQEGEIFNALLATAHETGHATYESGLPAHLEGLPAGQARNLCLHESQSLLFEKQIFLSRPFIDFFTPSIHSILPATSSVESKSFWQTATKVTPSLIRVEADEVTYPLHVILRFEIERDLINGAIEIDDIPELWDLKMQQYLSISTKGNYKDGCMQDMHWTDGSFGYFPSYTIGALNSAQLFNTIRESFSDWREQLQNGSIGFIFQWLSDNVWSKGSTMESQEILTRATGQQTSPAFFLQHLKDRYLEERY